MKDKLQEKIKELATDFQEIFECPVCFNMMDFTLKLCINGHGVCNSCAKKIEKCPTCQQELSVLRQNTLLGKVLERMPKLCPYSDNGCDTVILDNEHKIYCEYRPTKCLKKFCLWEGCVKDLLYHVKHCEFGSEFCEMSLNLEIGRFYRFNLHETKSFFTPIIFENQVFWRFFERDGKTKCIYHQLYMLPTSKQSCDHYLVVSFRKGGIKFEHSCKAEAYGTDENKNDVRSGLIISDSQMKKFLQPGFVNKFEYWMKLVKE